MGESCWNSLQTRMPAPELAAMGQTRRRPGRGGAHNGSVAIEDSAEAAPVALDLDAPRGAVDVA